MHYFAENNFDSLLEQFEDMWSFEASGADSVWRFVNSFAREKICEVEELHDLTAELVQIDIERWWMHWEKLVAELSFETPPEQLLRLFSKRATVENYLGILPGPPKNTEFWARLIETETSARDRWGDQIGVTYFNKRFGLEMQTAQANGQVVLRCDLENQNQTPPHCQLRLPLRGSTLIGRQRSYDPSALMVQENEEGNRIVVASRQDVTISREQLTVQLLCPNLAIVQNVSQVNAIVISPHRILPIQERTVVELPFAVKLHGRKLRCYHRLTESQNQL